MSALRTDARLAWQLVRGTGRREWWRIGLTAVGAAAATGFALAAVTLAALRGTHRVPWFHGLLDQPGTRAGIVVGLLLSLVPVLGFLGQCARVGAVHRDRRLAALRLAGATPWQVRRIAALETGLAGLLGAVPATVCAVVAVLRAWREPTAALWAGVALVAVAVPLSGAAVSALALRRVVASPLGSVRRVTPRSGRGPGLLFLGALLLVAAAAPALTVTGGGPGGRAPWQPTTVVCAAVLAVGAGAVRLSGAASRLTGKLLAARARTAATLIAAERLRADPWATARTHAALLLVTVTGTAFLCVRQVLLADLARNEHSAAELAYYGTGLNLTGAALLISLAIALSGLAVGTAESLADRRRTLAAQIAAGVPRAVLGRTLLWETALPLAPAVLLAGAGGLAVGAGYASLAGTGSLPATAFLLPCAVYASCLAAAATALPLLRRSVRPGELRHA
ncbi:FtsX-like permease family protein [Streptomyces ziwulingensis]|uniref:ABC3 transporter permease C-terminal domain-containing protein n=1 Tax=Streptomyces ziwulingensis TaxID=1045501 RepID=A0ABP9BYU9_9ACTN